MAPVDKTNTTTSCGCCSPATGGAEHDGAPSRLEMISVAVSGALCATGLASEWMGWGGAWLSRAAWLAAVIPGAWLFLPGAYRALRRLVPDMNLLMSIAVLGALAIDAWAEAAVVVFLFSLSELLESLASRRSQQALQSLLEVAPETALVQQDGRVVERPVEDVAVDESVLVRSGQRIPLDGIVVAGGSTVDEAPITGESLPVDKSAGDTVFAGTINGAGSLEVRVTKVAGNTTLARIIQLVHDAQEQRAPTQRFVDVFARYYTPAVVMVALLVATGPPLLADSAWSVWCYRALVLLVIACPCALVIATPVAIVTGMTVLARRGVLVKGGEYLESLGKLRALAVDKTGTITEGRPRVLGVLAYNDNRREDVVRIAAAVDDHSTHPLAQAVVAHARETGVLGRRADDYLALSGRGAEGTVDDHRYFVGNHRLTRELGVCSSALERHLDAVEEQGRSVVVVGHKPHDHCKGGVLGVVSIGDTVRPDAKAAIDALHAAGIEEVVMLSGDNSRTARAIAAEVGIDDVRGDLLPQDKVDAVRSLRQRHRYVGMVGDGVNDAPALATATVGFAMGAAGTDAAIETADVALMNDNLSKVAEAIHLGRRTLGIIRFNIVFALGLKALFLTLAVLGYTSLWLAILADTGATLVVIANALRLLRMARGSRPV